jgi:hypothetical protein
MRMPLLGLLVVLLHSIGIATPLDAQVGGLSAGAGAAFQTYRFDKSEATNIESISLATVPFALGIGLPASSRLEVSGAYARALLTRSSGSDSKIEGLTDTRISLHIPAPGQSVGISAVAVLPTGITTPTREEAQVAGAIASDLLPFNISHWGTGGGGGMVLDAARDVAGVGVEIAASYFLYREHDAAESVGLAAYRPGSQLAVQVGMAQNIGRVGRATLQLSHQRQGEDRLADENLFRAGNRTQVIGSYAFRLGRSHSGIFYAGGQRRDRGTALVDLSTDVPSQWLVVGGAGLRIPLSGSVVLLPAIDGRIYRRGDGLGQGFLGGLGGVLEIPIGPLTLLPEVRGHLGRVLIRERSESGLLGLDLGLTISRGGP